jgi:hypothetical protein
MKTITIILSLLILSSCNFFTNNDSLPGCTSNCVTDVAPVFSATSSTSVTAVVGTAITDVTITFSAEGSTTCSVTSGTLPTGLSLATTTTTDTVTCTISGTASGSATTENITVTASNTAGSDTNPTAVAISVKTLPSLSSQSSSSSVLDKNAAMTNITLTFTGSDVSSGSCGISPTLTGVSVAGAASGSDLICTISGTPTAVATSTSYTITATSTNGSGTGSVTLEVVSPRCSESFDLNATPSGDGDSAYPYIICTGAQLETVINLASSADTNIHMHIQADIDFDSPSVVTTPLANNNSDAEFLGTLNGNGFKISKTTNKFTSSIFSTLSSGTIISRTEFVDVNITGVSIGLISSQDDSSSTLSSLIISDGTISGNGSAPTIVFSTGGSIEDIVITNGLTISNAPSLCIAGSTTSGVNSSYYDATHSCDDDSIASGNLDQVDTTDSNNLPSLTTPSLWTLTSGSAPVLVKRQFKSSSASSLGSL